jgi:hypothetical protein
MLNIFTALPSSKLAIGIAVLPLAIPIGYLLYLDRAVATQCKTATGIRDRRKRTATIPPNIPRPVTLPQEVEPNDSEWVLAYERIVSRPVGLSSIPYDLDTDLATVLTTYVRATMTAFSWTPQAFVLRASAGDDAVKKTFDTHFIQSLRFSADDRVNGFWRVTHRGDGGVEGNERVEMALDAPPTYRGPLVGGVIVAGMERQGDGHVVFVNETWMWRRQGEAPVLLEGRVGQWFHVVLSGWLVMKGVKAVSEGKQKSV